MAAVAGGNYERVETLRANLQLLKKAMVGGLPAPLPVNIDPTPQINSSLKLGMGATCLDVVQS